MSETKAAFAERTQFIDSVRYSTQFSKKLLDRLDTKECKEFRLFVHSVQQTSTRI